MDATAQAMSARTLTPKVFAVKGPYGYDQASNRLWCKNVVASTGQEEFYTYDGLYQVSTFQRGTLNTGRTGLTGTPAWEEDFTFDAPGNWTHYTTKAGGATTLDQSRVHNAVNEITRIAGSSSLIAQNAAGNITKAPTPDSWSSAYTMVYDAWQRLVQVNSGSSVVGAYAYDGQGWRTTKTTGSTVRHYYYNSQWQVVDEYVGTSADRQYVWGLLGPDNLVVRYRPALSETLYALSDPNGCVTAVMNDPSTWTVYERYGYESFGKPRFMNASFGAISASAYDWTTLYDSYPWDSESGYYQVRNRYLHPTLGRWLIRDPIGYEGGVNLYAYVRNNGVNWTDALGLQILVCSRKVKGFPYVGNHTYFYNTDPSAKCQSCGLGASSGVGASSGSGSTSSGNSLCGQDKNNTSEKGPKGGDKCSPVPGTGPDDPNAPIPPDAESTSSNIMNCCQKTANSGPYIPGIHDCHNAVNRCLDQNNFTIPSAPRLGPPSVGPIEKCPIEPLPPSPPSSPPPPGPPGKR
jgi:RHS repeat-associated protein